MIWPFGRRRKKEEPDPGIDDGCDTVLIVPDDAGSIQEAIDAAPRGARIVVRPGRYRENLDFSGKEMSVCSEDPRDPSTVARTIIEAAREGAVVTIGREEGEGARLAGFTITGGRGRLREPAEGGGITIRNHSRPVIENNIIVGNYSRLDGGGIHIDDAAPTVMWNQIKDNVADGCGGGLHIGRDSVLSTGYEVEPAFGERMGGFLDHSMPRSVQISGQEDDSAHALRDDAAADIVPDREREERPRPVVEGNTVRSNRALWGGGLFVSDEAPRVEGNAFRANSAQRGGGICVWDNSRAVLVRNMLLENEAKEEGGAVIVEWGASALLLDNRVARNRSALGAVSVATNSAPVLQRNTFSGNECSEGGALHLWKSHLAVVQDNEMEDDGT